MGNHGNSTIKYPILPFDSNNDFKAANIVIDLMEVHVIDRRDSIANHYMAELRDIKSQLDRMRFRKNLERLGAIMAYEFSKTLDFVVEDITTPLGNKPTMIIQNEMVVITVLRAGLPYFNGFMEVFDHLDAGFIGAYRASEGTMENIDVTLNYIATQNLADKEVILVDPMLATGKSVIEAIAALEKNGKPKKVHIFSVIAAPEGVNNLKQVLDIPADIWTVSLDEKLNDQSYIIPGLGDAGDLSFGEKI